MQNAGPKAGILGTSLGWRTSLRLIATSNEGFDEHDGCHFMNPSKWRWRESNPRPLASQRAFSERSRQLSLGTLAAAGGFVGPQLSFSVPDGRTTTPSGKPR